MDNDLRDALILTLSEKLYICSCLLSRAAERLKWDNDRVQELVERLNASIKEDCRKYGVATAST